MTQDPRTAARALARRQDGVVSRRQLRALGLNRDAIAHDASKGRLQIEGRAVIACVVPLNEAGRWRVVLANSGPRAVLDGVTALRASGLEGFTDRIHVSVPMGGRAIHAADVTVHTLRGYRDDDVIDVCGLRRTAPAIAAVRAAVWAASDRAAVTVLAMTLQQRLTSVAELATAADRLPTKKRRGLVLNTIGELSGGATSLPEIDFAQLCRKYGLPEPTRQVKRRRKNGTAYLDVLWEEFNLIVEVDGIHHGSPIHVVPDALRHNDIALGGVPVLRIPAVGLLVATHEFMAQVRLGLINGGWRP